MLDKSLVYGVEVLWLCVELYIDLEIVIKYSC